MPLKEVHEKKRQALIVYIEYSPPTSYLDSELDVTKMSPGANAELILKLRVFLDQDVGGTTVTDGRGLTWTAKPWTPGDWMRFKQSFQSQGHRAWDRRFWLRTPFGYRPLETDGYRHHINCRFQLDVVASAAAASRVVKVIQLGRTSNPGGFSSWGSQEGGHLTNFDTMRLPYLENGRFYTQRTLEHELGHMLGLDHIGTVSGVSSCTPDNQAAEACYCANPNDCGDMMGMGHRVSVKDAVPWLNRIEQHTQTSSLAWELSTKPLVPEPCVTEYMVETADCTQTWHGGTSPRHAAGSGGWQIVGGP
jgi:hypothetical protein